MKTKNLILFIFLVSAFFIVINTVSADGCCLRSTTNEYCVNESDGASQANCVEGSWLSQNCGSVDVCANRGCCFVGGSCDDNSPQIRCTSNSGDFTLNTECRNAQSCRNVCCQLPLGYRYMGESDCTSEGGTALDDPADEPSCRALNYGVDANRVCCVSGNGTCVRELSEDCDASGGSPRPGFYCRDVLDCNPACVGRHHTGPGQVGDEVNRVYWYDSCGNQEDLVDPSDPRSAFDAVGLQPFNGDCNADPSTAVDFSSNGQFVCANMTCTHVWDNPYTDENHDGILTNDNAFGFGSIRPTSNDHRMFRYNKESWCEYQQAKVGPGLDLPGTRHYKHYCDRGKEMVETAGVGREQICTEQLVEKNKIAENGHNLTFTMSQVNWIQNDADSCLQCNSPDISAANQTQVCCTTKQSCVYIDIRNVVQDRVNITIDKSSFDNMQDGISQADRFLKLRYWRGEELIREEDFSSAVEGADASCSSPTCPITIINPPHGEYELTVYGKGCDCFIGCICETKEVSLGTHQLSPAVDSGACVPLVPPSGTSSCGKFSEFGFSDITPYTSYNYYYNLPYNSFGLGSECDNTEECRPRFLENISNLRAHPLELNLNESTVIAYFLADNTNSLCKAFGDCGYSPNILGTVSPFAFNESEYYNLTEEGQTVFVSNPICLYIIGVNSTSGCYRIVYHDYSTIESGKYSRIINGTPTRPEDFSSHFAFFFIPLPLISLFRKIKKNYLFFILLSFLIILSACGDSISLGDRPPDAYLACDQWRPAAGTGDCWKCNANRSSGGVLPDVNLTLADGTPAYQCTRELCNSLGLIDQQCSFVGNDSGGFCVAYTQFSVPRINFLGTNFTCNSLTPEGCQATAFNTNNNENPNLEIPGKLDANFPVDISFKTVGTGDVSGDFATSCVYGFSHDVLDKQVEGNRFSINHNLHLVGLVAKSEPYNVYIQCMDAQSDPSTIANVKFSVGEGVDIGSPVIYQIVPQGNHPYVRFNETTKEIALYVRGHVSECRWDNKSVNFGDMGNTTRVIPGGAPGGGPLVESNITNSFRCTAGGEPQYGGSVCTANVRGVKLGDNRYWFACVGTNRQASDPYPSDGFVVKGTEQLNISEVSCEHSLGTNCDRIFDNSFNFSLRTAGGAEQGSAKCRWAVDGYDYDCFSDPGCVDPILREPNYGAYHKQINYAHETGVITLRFLCGDAAENIAQKNVTISVERDQTPPKITKVYRYGDELYLQTNELSTCYYLTNTTASFTDATQFTTENSLEHHTTLSQINGITGNFYRVRCEDRFNNKKDMDVYISKL